MTNFERYLKRVEIHTKLSPICGGTYSSGMLRSLLEVRKQVKNANHLERIDIMIEAWRKALINHNGQERRLLEYDVDTGEII